MTDSAPAQQNQLFLMIGRMESKVDLLLSKVDELEKRIDNLEQNSQTQRGIFMAAKTLWIGVAALVGAFSDNIIHFVMGK